jgi:osmotically-inducible protein OsmY
MIPRILAAFLALMLAAGVCFSADKASDDLIRDRVMLRVGSDPDAKVGNLDVESKAGVITLTGTVETTAQKNKAGALAKKVKGVKQVINNITLRERTSGK